VNSVASRISASEKVTSIFEYWPSFHDAEVLDISLKAGSGPETASLDLRAHVFRMTSEVTSDGFFVCDRHTIVVLRFREIESVQIEEFGYQNVLDKLEFDFDRADGKIWVGLLGVCGADGEFVCRSVEVVSAEPGIPPHSVYRKAEA